MRGLLSLFCLSVLLGSVSAQDQALPLYPLKKGAKWTYKSNKGNVEVTVTGTEQVDKEDTFKLETRFDGMVATENIAVRKDGLYRVKVGADLAKPALMLLKTPAKKGDSWAISSAIGPETLTGKFTVGETEVDWNKEKKKAITVTGSDMTANGKKLTLAYTFLENVGLFTQTMSLEGVEVKLELIKYDPPKE